MSNVVETELINAEFFINSISIRYELQTKKPQIKVDSNLGAKYNNKDLYYDPDDMSINISGLLILKYFESKNLIELEQTRNAFLWGIAHEFFHHGRNHIAVWNHYGIKQTDNSSKQVQILRFLEDDSDTLATAALYRHFLNNVYKDSDSYSIKLKVLATLFKIIRLKILAHKSEPLIHPAWSTRLYSQMIKLSELDNIFNNPLNSKERITKSTNAQRDMLLGELIKLEKGYSDNSDLTDYYLKPVDYPKEIASSDKITLRKSGSYYAQVGLDLYYLNESHKELEVILRKNCNLPGLNVAKHQI